MRRRGGIHNIEDLRCRAKRRLPRFAFDYIDGGAEDETGLVHNREVLQRCRFIPRYLNDVSTRSTATELFGYRYSVPFGIAPTALAGLIAPGTDLALAGEAKRRNMPFVLSTPAATSIETVATLGAGDWFWFQIYIATDERMTDDLIERARVAGARTLVVTVDVPIPSKRERDLRNGLRVPLKLTFGNLLDFLAHPRWLYQMLRQGPPRFANMERYMAKGSDWMLLAQFMASTISASFTWADLERIRRRWSGPLVAKGIMHPDDAKRCVSLGCDGVWLSNHGGRQLDAALSPMEVLPEARRAVGPDCKLLIDSGFRRGSDIAKALALGADFVFMGRPGLYGAAAGGAAGVRLAFDLIADEFDRALAQLGCRYPHELRTSGVSR